MTRMVDRELSVQALQSALPYIRLYRGRLFVVKIGGAICGDLVALADLAKQVSVLSEFGIRVVLVHGGGPQTTALSNRLGFPTRFAAGRRITDENVLEVAVMTMNGTVNTAILSACRAAGISAVGLSGLDAGLVRATRRGPVTKEVDGEPTTIDYGLVGDVVRIEPAVLRCLLEAGMLPVVSPLSADDSGQVLIINADTVAASIAASLSAEKLVFVTDTPGLLSDAANPSSLVSYVDLKGLETLISRGAVGGGMLPKLAAAMGALEAGVGRVHMVGYRARSSLLVEVFTNEGAGTLIVKSASDLLPAEHSHGSIPPGAMES